MAGINTIVPEKFLCKYNLRTGSIVAGIFIIVMMSVIVLIMVISVIITLIELLKSPGADHFMKTFGYAPLAIIYSILMILVNIWFLWGVLKYKATVVICWLVLTVMWLILFFLTMLLMICIHYATTSITSLSISLVFGFLLFGIMTYFTLTVYGYWLELKQGVYNSQSSNG